MEAPIISSFDFLTALIKNVNFANFIINNNSEIEDSIKTYRQDVDCSCKHTITKYYNNNQALISKQVEDFCKEQKILVSELFKVSTDNINSNARNVLKPTLPSSEWPKYKDVIGEIVEITPNPDEYKKVLSIAREKWLYNGINILETMKLDPVSGKEDIVWLLLFY